MNVLIVSPHPDDETLGAGGTLLKYKYNGNKIFWLNITNMKEEYGYKKEIVEIRKEQILRVREEFQFDDYYDLELKPACLENYESDSIIKRISLIIDTIKPNVLILPNRSDIHSDHKKVFDWCYSCTKIFRYSYIKMILTMEILSETDFGVIDNYFVPNYYVDITDYFQHKSNILQIYESELAQHPFPRSIEGIEAIAKYRGISAGSKYAEAFKVLKIID